MKGKLLNYVESFCWNDKKINRSIFLQNYNNALNEARKVGDQVFCPETMYHPENEDVIFQFMWLNGYNSFDELKVYFEWLTVEDFQVLLNLHNIMGGRTSRSSNTWVEFELEYGKENKSLIGLEDQDCSNPLVYNIPTHKKFHSDYVATFDFSIQKAQYEYFKKYYIPTLRLDISSIERLILREQVNRRIIRLDSPTSSPNGEPIHSQQIHIHIKINNDECALNIDGTWKHPPRNLNDRISNDICITLCEWGFCLPEDYY